MNGSSDGLLDSGMCISLGKSGSVLLISSDPDLQSEWSVLLRAMGYTVIPEPGPGPQATNGNGTRPGPDLILLLSPGDEASTIESIRQSVQGEQAPPLIVFGQPSGPKWPKRALEAGAFGYLPLDTNLEHQAGLLAAAVRYREMQNKVQLLLQESERLCADLVGSFGQTSEKLTDKIQEVQKAQKALQDVQARIVKAFT